MMDKDTADNIRWLPIQPECLELAKKIIEQNEMILKINKTLLTSFVFPTLINPRTKSGEET